MQRKRLIYVAIQTREDEYEKKGRETERVSARVGEGTCVEREREREREREIEIERERERERD